jgi:hypothetical protein
MDPDPCIDRNRENAWELCTFCGFHSFDSRGDICLRVTPPFRNVSSSGATLLFLPRRQAAQRKQISVSSFKRHCRRSGIQYWPYRAHRRVERCIDAVFGSTCCSQCFTSSIQKLLELQRLRAELVAFHSASPSF